MSAGQRSQVHTPIGIEELEIDFIKLSEFHEPVFFVTKGRVLERRGKCPPTHPTQPQHKLFLSLSSFPHLCMIGHLHPKRRFQGLESPASHNSKSHGAVCQGVDISGLKFWPIFKFLESSIVN